MCRLPLRSTRNDARLPYTTLFRSAGMLHRSVGCNAFARINFPFLRRRKRQHLAHLRCGCSDRHEEAGGYGTAARHLLSGIKLSWLRSEEHTSELQSLMRISYAVSCLKKKNYAYSHLSTYLIT